MFPKSGALLKQMPIPEPDLTYLSESPVKEPFLEALHTEPLEREKLHP
jgi:hypothetical protein